jgi:hypothetical protein
VLHGCEQVGCHEHATHHGFLGELQVAVIAGRQVGWKGEQDLHFCEEPVVIRPGQFQHIGVLLLRHDAAAGTVFGW